MSSNKVKNCTVKLEAIKKLINQILTKIKTKQTTTVGNNTLNLTRKLEDLQNHLRELQSSITLLTHVCINPGGNVVLATQNTCSLKAAYDKVQKLGTFNNTTNIENFTSIIKNYINEYKSCLNPTSS